jgi:hypothetical protein
MDFEEFNEPARLSIAALTASGVTRAEIDRSASELLELSVRFAPAFLSRRFPEPHHRQRYHEVAAEACEDMLLALLKGEKIDSPSAYLRKLMLNHAYQIFVLDKRYQHTKPLTRHNSSTSEQADAWQNLLDYRAFNYPSTLAEMTITGSLGLDIKQQEKLRAAIARVEKAHPIGHYSAVLTNFYINPGLNYLEEAQHACPNVSRNSLKRARHTGSRLLEEELGRHSGNEEIIATLKAIEKIRKSIKGLGSITRA